MALRYEITQFVQNFWKIVSKSTSRKIDFITDKNWFLHQNSGVYKKKNNIREQEWKITNVFMNQLSKAFQAFLMGDYIIILFAKSCEYL